MNTPSHAILNLAILIAPQQPTATLPIVFGAVLPDVPMFVMYCWAKVIRRQSEYQIWSETYFSPFWQNITHAFHSIPLALIGIFLAHYFGWWQAEIIGISAFLHALADFPVHNEDAHRHFLPFSNYRFISPISYWNPNYHGRVVSLIEKLLVLIATFYVFPLQQSWVSKGLLIAVNFVYLSGYLYIKLFRRCQHVDKEKEWQAT
ncbi:hypothetical protein [Fischerella sp. PCC 9605]|uniref:hypothetical protein n=1 Tax=Fischerella sp. PCC 9605 TaxID=1173024 RepID=UPI0004786830|nr:hypothetical protein [Fischerella sp. PCC 9605]